MSRFFDWVVIVGAFIAGVANLAAGEIGLGCVWIVLGGTRLDFLIYKAARS